MADPFLFLFVIISLVILSIYLVVVFRGNVRFLPRHAVLGKHLGKLDGERVYVFMGGMSLLWASVNAIEYMPYGTSTELSEHHASQPNPPSPADSGRPHTSDYDGN